MWSLVPSWAPNLHPLVVHFPIALLLTAVTVDVFDVTIARPAWLGTAATGLYVAGAIGAIAASMTGLQAVETVLMPGMAHPVVRDHRLWALTTTGYFGLLATIRLAVGLRAPGGSRRKRRHVLLLAAALTGAVLLQQTAERGARLVYEFGAGVIGAPGPR
jgi:uncharacterized membrane protein